MIKGSIQQEDITFINIYSPNRGIQRYMKQILMDLRGEIESNTIIIRSINTTLTSMGVSSRQIINEESLG